MKSGNDKRNLSAAGLSGEKEDRRLADAYKTGPETEFYTFLWSMVLGFTEERDR
jgi:hypothetical protein